MAYRTELNELIFILAPSGQKSREFFAVGLYG
jgi:hypothetical protein